MSLDPAEFADIYRREIGRCTATLIRVLGDVDLAEDAVAEAFAIAAERWQADGVPPNPGGWITTTARNRAIDRIRRESSRPERERQSMVMHEITSDDRHAADLGPLDAVPDDQLRLMFLCCHPALGIDAQVALTLRLVGGLTTSEIARAFLVPEPTMGQRLSRAKRKIRDTHMAYRIPADDALPRRLGGVLAAVYLIYTEGHTTTGGDDLIRSDLTSEALRIGRTLVDLLPDQPEALGLHALMLLTEARAPARVDSNGQLIRLADQDRSTWDGSLIEEGHRLVRACLAANRPGPYQIQAAIAAVHATASDASDTDWPQIVALYDHLSTFRPTAVVALNRAIAVMESEGPEAALAELDHLELSTSRLFHAARAEALTRLGRTDAAAAALRRAISVAGNASETRHLESALAELS